MVTFWEKRLMLFLVLLWVVLLDLDKEWQRSRISWIYSEIWNPCSEEGGTLKQNEWIWSLTMESRKSKHILNLPLTKVTTIIIHEKEGQLNQIQKQNLEGRGCELQKNLCKLVFILSLYLSNLWKFTFLNL